MAAGSIRLGGPTFLNTSVTNQIQGDSSMEEEQKPEKEGFFKRLFGGGKKGACCSAVKVEEIPDDQPEPEKRKTWASRS
jgi:hypothetical protein